MEKFVINSNCCLLTHYSSKQSIFNTLEHLVDACALVTATPGAMTLRRVNLSSEEDNAIRYANGFVTTHFLKKYENMRVEKVA